LFEDKNKKARKKEKKRIKIKNIMYERENCLKVMTKSSYLDKKNHLLKPVL